MRSRTITSVAFASMAACAAVSAAQEPAAPIQWGAVLRANAGAGTLVKASGCNGCADAWGVGAHAVPAENGSVEFTPAYGHRLVGGLADTAVTIPSASTMPYAFGFWPDGGWDIRERGTYRTEGRAAPGDAFRIAIDGGVVRYYRNGQIVFTSAARSTAPSRFGVMLYSKDASLSNAVMMVAIGGPALTAYDGGVADRLARAEPILPLPGGAGSTMTDPTFGTTIVRITDSVTRPSKPGRSFRTPSGTHQHAWSALGNYFYIVGHDGTIIPYAFDGRTGVASRLQPSATGAGGLTLKFFNEAQFSYLNDQRIYATYNGSGATMRTIDQYDFSTGTYTRLLDLDVLVPGLAGTYVGGVNSTAGPVERILAFFGGTGQDRHHYLVVFDKDDPSRRRLLDTTASTLDGVPTPIPLQFKLHHASIDRSGRFVLLYPTAADMAAPRLAAHVYVWDTTTDLFTVLGSKARSNGHDAPGYGTLVNQDCCTTTTWDAAQWQWRRLDSPLATRDLILPILTPKEIYLAEHPAWHNARPDVGTPFITALYRYNANAVEWRAWDDEIVAVQTDVPPGAAAAVWRLAHHRSDVANDGDPSRIYFWYTPRPNVSPDGRWVLFTSNWEKTLGADTAPVAGGGYRQDVFLLKAR